MPRKTLGLLLITILWLCNSNAQESFRVMFYNLLNFPNETATSGREDNLRLILGDYQPDLFLVCELNTSAGANTILGITQSEINAAYQMATFVNNTSDDSFGDSNELQNLLFYDSNKFTLEEEIIVPTDLRDFNVYRLTFNTVDKATNPVEIYVVVAHLKASDTDSDALRRFTMVQELDGFLNTLPSNTNVLLGGDLNLYRATESAFQELLDGSNNITFADPVNRIGNWSDTGNTFVDVFTQSTRTQSGLGGAAGGFDDRFDFILTSENFLNASNNIRYVSDSYSVYGNNQESSCFNRRINSSDCAEGADNNSPDSNAGFSFTIRDALHNFSDHLPVTIELEIDSQTLSTEDETIANNLLLKKNIIDSELEILINDSRLFNESFIIYNNLGQEILASKFENETQLTINVSQLSTGLYYLSIPNSGLKPTKFVIAH